MRFGIQGPTAATIRRITIPRALGVTLGLGIAGAAVGASIGAGMLGVISLGIDGPGGFPYFFDAYLFAGAIGAGLGVIAYPYIAWSLPTVSIGRILAATTMGTAIGGTAGLLGTNLDFIGAVLGAVFGFGCGASWLAIRSSEIRRRED
jgi:hypothetical protein